ncbi:transposase [Pseudomonas sp. FP453]|nr:transposase [Pseudomonas sp. FP453]WLH93079.1 transposase [Pseudomonas sp. FP453]
MLEATGGYERQVMKALQAADLEVVRINPSRARSFARALGLQAKTDPIDAKLLAHFAATIKPPKSQPTSPEQRLTSLGAPARELCSAAKRR